MSKTYGSVPLRFKLLLKRDKETLQLFSFFINFFQVEMPSIVWFSAYCSIFFLTVGSLVDRKIVNDGDKSISWSPMVIRTRPPVRRSSRFNTGFRIGS